MKIETVKISTVKPNPANPRTIRDDKFHKLVQSVKDFPQMLKIRPIVVNDQLEVLGGNMRLRACIEAGMKEVTIIRASELTEDQQREFIIKDNVGFGDWDYEALANEWDEKELGEWGLDLPGFAGKQEAEDDDYEMPDEIQTDIVLGDLFEIGNHRLLCGDSTKKEDVEKLMNGAIADLVFTDPDFSMDFDLVRECYKNSKLFSKGIAFWVCADKQSVQLASNDFDNFSKFFVQDFRQATLVANNQPMTRHVMICQFGKRPMNNLHDGFSTLLQIATDRTSEAHKVTPMSKKPELAFEFIGHYTEENEIVLDLFCHSGSTLIAAHQLKRKMYGMEIEPKYCQCVIDRISEFDPSLEIKKNGITFVNALV